jgi:hypothetical protein
MATDSSNPEIRYNSYADFVVQKYGGNGYHDYREDTWLVQFLRRGYSKGSLGLLDIPVEIDIWIVSRVELNCTTHHLKLTGGHESSKHS